MKKEYFTIGRDDSSDILLYGDLTSREHATLRFSKRGKYVILDHSTNGTFVNGIPLQSGVEYEISRNDQVDFAHSEVLDWQLVPKKTRLGLRLILIAVSLVALLAIALGIVYFFKTYDIAKKQPPTVEEPVIVQRDSTSVTDTVKVVEQIVEQPVQTKELSKKEIRKQASDKKAVNQEKTDKEEQPQADTENTEKKQSEDNPVQPLL